MPDLGAWLRERLHRPRAAGIWDCCTLPAEWTLACGYPDPMAKWRGTYGSEEEAAGLISDAGGLLALFDQGFAEAGVSRRNGVARQGDVGVLAIGELEAGSIYVGPRWSFIGQRGLGFASVDPDCVAAVWAVGD